MSSARSEIHGWGECEGSESPECRKVDELLNRVEDDRAHAEAEKLRRQADEAEKSLLASADPALVFRTTDTIRTAANMIDPYEMRDGQLVRKSDGQPVPS